MELTWWLFLSYVCRLLRVTCVVPLDVTAACQVRDAKCLHAHVADALMRGRGANAIGRDTLELLEARGVPTGGRDRCQEQCNFRVEETAESWR